MKEAEAIFRQLKQQLDENNLLFIRRIEEPVKVQTSSTGNKILIYNKDKTVVHEIDQPELVNAIRKKLDLDVIAKTYVIGVILEYKRRDDDDNDYAIVGITSEQLPPKNWPTW